jgi:hypothetical protein
MAFFALMAAVSFFPAVGMAVRVAVVVAAGDEEEGEKEEGQTSLCPPCLLGALCGFLHPLISECLGDLDLAF